MRKGLLAIVVVLLMPAAANALTVRLSLDGVNPAPDAIDVMPSEVIDMYVISDGAGQGYWQYLWTGTGLAIISGVQSYPAAGDLASITDVGETYPRYRLEANDSEGNILAGKHFGFDVTIAWDAPAGAVRYVKLAAGTLPTDSVAVNVVPEPGTVLLLGLGGLVLLRIRKRK